MNIGGIVFDKDGTLFDFSATWTPWAKRFLTSVTGGDVGLAVNIGDAIGFDYLNEVFDPVSPVIAGTPDEIAELILPFFPDRDATALAIEINTVAEEASMAEAVPLAPLLDELRGRGLVLGLATNDAEAPARAHLGAVGVLDRFAFVSGSDSGYGGKPQPGQLLGFCEQTGLTREQVIMVGDSTHDLIAGRAAGMIAVAVLTGIAEQAELSPFADVVLPDIGHLPAWLDARGG